MRVVPVPYGEFIFGSLLDRYHLVEQQVLLLRGHDREAVGSVPVLEGPGLGGVLTHELEMPAKAAMGVEVGGGRQGLQGSADDGQKGRVALNAEGIPATGQGRSQGCPGPGERIHDQIPFDREHADQAVGQFEGKGRTALAGGRVGQVLGGTLEIRPDSENQRFRSSQWSRASFWVRDKGGVVPFVKISGDHDWGREEVQ